MSRNRSQSKKPPVKKNVSGKNIIPPVEAISNPSGWKKFWLAANFDWKALIATIALIISILTFYQNNNRIYLDKFKKNARECFNLNNFDEAFKSYKKVYKIDPEDVEGYLKFMCKGTEILVSEEWECNSDIKLFFDRAKELTKDATEVDKMLKLCKQQ